MIDIFITKEEKRKSWRCYQRSNPIYQKYKSQLHMLDDNLSEDEEWMIIQFARGNEWRIEFFLDQFRKGNLKRILFLPWAKELVEKYYGAQAAILLQDLWNSENKDEGELFLKRFVMKLYKTKESANLEWIHDQEYVIVLMVN